MQAIRTKWRRLIPLIDEGAIYIPAPNGGHAVLWEDHRFLLVREDAHNE